jgi:hypothetical protein
MIVNEDDVDWKYHFVFWLCHQMPLHSRWLDMMAFGFY